MSDYNPRKDRNDQYPWRARVKRGHLSIFIGRYQSKEAADAAERQFKRNRGWTKPKRPIPHAREVNGSVVLVNCGTRKR